MKQYLMNRLHCLFSSAFLRKHGIQVCTLNVYGKAYVAFMASQLDKVLSVLGWTPETVVELPTPEVSAWILQSRSSVQWQPQFDCPPSLSSATHRYLNMIAEWCEQHAAALPAPVMIHYHQAFRDTTLEPGYLHLCFGARLHEHQHHARVNGRYVGYQHGRLWINEGQTDTDEAWQIATEILDRYLPRICGKPWIDGTCFAHPVVKNEIDALSRKPYFLTARVEKQEEKTYLALWSRQRALLRPYEDEPPVYDVGEATIVIPLGKGAPLEGVTISVTGKHPHLLSGDTLCWGTSRVKAYAAAHMREGRLSALCDILWIFLNSFNPVGHLDLSQRGMNCYR